MTKTRTIPKVPSQRSTTSSPPDPTLQALDRALKAVPDTGPKADPRRDRGRIAFWVFLAVMAVSIAGAVVFTQQGSQTEETNDRLQRVIQVECMPGGRFFGLPICLAIDPSASDQATEDAVGAGLDTAGVTQLVRAELARSPGRTQGDVEAAARKVLTENPGLYRGVQGVTGATGVPGATGAPGAPATGIPGAPGDPGPGPTDEQVRAAAQMVMAADPQAFKGDTGPQGVGLQALDFQTRDGQCVAVVTLVDPASGATSERTSPVGNAACTSVVAPERPAPSQPDPGPDPTTTEDSPDPGTPSTTPEPDAPSTTGGPGSGIGDLLGD